MTRLDAYVDRIGPTVQALMRQNATFPTNTLSHTVTVGLAPLATDPGAPRSALAHHVGHVVGLRAQVQMVGVAARRVVALVQDE
jgi:hypothetical protein